MDGAPFEIFEVDLSAEQRKAGGAGAEGGGQHALARVGVLDLAAPARRPATGFLQPAPQLPQMPRGRLPHDQVFVGPCCGDGVRRQRHRFDLCRKPENTPSGRGQIELSPEERDRRRSRCRHVHGAAPFARVDHDVSLSWPGHLAGEGTHQPGGVRRERRRRGEPCVEDARSGQTGAGFPCAWPASCAGWPDGPSAPAPHESRESVLAWAAMGVSISQMAQSETTPQPRGACTAAVDRAGGRGGCDGAPRARHRWSAGRRRSCALK